MALYECRGYHGAATCGDAHEGSVRRHRNSISRSAAAWVGLVGGSTAGVNVTQQWRSGRAAGDATGGAHDRTAATARARCARRARAPRVVSCGAAVLSILFGARSFRLGRVPDCAETAAAAVVHCEWPL